MNIWPQWLQGFIQINQKHTWFQIFKASILILKRLLACLYQWSDTDTTKVSLYSWKRFSECVSVCSTCAGLMGKEEHSQRITIMWQKNAEKTKKAKQLPCCQECCMLNVTFLKPVGEKLCCREININIRIKGSNSEGLCVYDSLHHYIVCKSLPLWIESKQSDCQCVV